MDCVVVNETYRIHREFDNIGDARAFAMDVIENHETNGAKYISYLGIWTPRMYRAHESGLSVLPDGRSVHAQEYIYAPGCEPWAQEARYFREC